MSFLLADHNKPLLTVCLSLLLSACLCLCLSVSSFCSEWKAGFRPALRVCCQRQRQSWRLPTRNTRSSRRRFLLITHRYVCLKTHLSVCLSVCQSEDLSVCLFENLSICLPVCHLEDLSVCLQVSESGKALLDVLQRCPVTDSDDSATTHGIMGVLHQVMQVS